MGSVKQQRWLSPPLRRPGSASKPTRDTTVRFQASLQSLLWEHKQAGLRLDYFSLLIKLSPLGKWQVGGCV